MRLQVIFRKIGSPLLWGNFLAMILVCIAFFVGLFLFLQYYTHHGENITIPNFKGQRSDVVQRKLQALGMRVEVSDTGYNENYAAGVVLDQSIAPGTQIKENRLISLTINSGVPLAVALPALSENCSLREARMKLENLGFILAPVKHIMGEKDWVYRILVNGHAVKAGERININRPLTLEVGNGRTTTYFEEKDPFDFHDFANDSTEAQD